ncbi:MAG: YraN family protein [Alphaproteobacteria bacterium]|nr:YraN family protein [Alphaproteobacteria bacterium]
MRKTTEQKRAETYERGLWAEGLAALYLIGKGYRVLKRRYKTKFGEIDLIVQKGDIICFVEVKARARESDALETVDLRTQARIEKAALYFLSENPVYFERGLRFDVVAVIPPAKVVHLDNAWEARS